MGRTNVQVVGQLSRKADIFVLLVTKQNIEVLLVDFSLFVDFQNAAWYYLGILRLHKVVTLSAKLVFSW